MKGQIQLGETIVVLLIFIILVGLGFAFYSRVTRVQIERDLREIEDQRSIQRVQAITKLPELRCSTDEVLDDDCIDLYKLRASGAIFEDEFYYKDILGLSAITVYQITPQNDAPFVVFNNLKSETFNTFFIPTLIYDPVLNEYHIGLINISVST